MLSARPSRSLRFPLALGLGLLCGLLTGLPLSAQETAGTDWGAIHGVLFRIHSPLPGKADSLLFGTIHIGTSDQLGLDLQRVRSAVEAQHVLVNEVDSQTPWEPRYDRYRFLADGQKLATLIGGTEFIELVTLLPERNGGQLNRFKPWVAMTLLEEGAEQAPPRSIDRIVEDMARVHGLRMVHLETLEDQLAALDCTPAADYAVVLQQRLTDAKTLREETERSLVFYRQGNLPGWLADIDAMHGLDAHAQKAERHARECLLEQRNTRWLEELDPLLRQGGCFVAVGAIHLTGKDGLLAGLARRGFGVSAQAW